MAEIKICGLRRAEDVDYANRVKPDYVGFIFADSRRKIDAELARELGSKLDKGIKKVGVFVNESLESLVEVYNKAELDIVQLHGDETLDYVGKLPEGIVVWKAIRVRSRDDIKKAMEYDKSERISALLLDAYDEKEYGGCGVSFDWNLIKDARFKKLILAGGLNAENVKHAIGLCSPDAVDVSSGVETEGCKDYEKIKDFVEKVRS